jgi:SAM-dependent methyltransferase
MKPDQANPTLQQGWECRQENCGDVPRAVLMKGVPDRVNLTIDRWHREVLRTAFFQWNGSAGPVLDIGCGYGRLGSEAKSLGIQSLVGLDFSPGFCRRFGGDCGQAVCGDLAHLPFGRDAFAGAYAVTSLMYLDIGKACEALRSLDECLIPGARVLILEPGAEFNTLVRSLLRRKKAEQLARPGFTTNEFHQQLAPHRWRQIASGSNGAMTFLFPLLLLVSRIPRLYSLVERLALRMDQPKADQVMRASRYAIYRWAFYEADTAAAAGDLRNIQT